MKSLVIVEHNNNSIKPSTFSTITAASQICEDIEALIIGYKLDKSLDELKKSNHLKKINVIEKESLSNPIAENFADEIISFLKSKDFTHVLTPSSTFGKNLSPKIATLLDVQQISDIIKIFDEKTFERPIYAGNAIAKVRSNDAIKIITVRSTCFEPCMLESNVQIESFSTDSSCNNLVNFVSLNESKSDRPELTSAKIIISGGRGLQNGENFKIGRNCDKLGAAMSASFERQLMQDLFLMIGSWSNGKIIAPDLYTLV